MMDPMPQLDSGSACRHYSIRTIPSVTARCKFTATLDFPESVTGAATRYRGDLFPGSQKR